MGSALAVCLGLQVARRQGLPLDHRIGFDMHSEREVLCRVPLCQLDPAASCDRPGRPSAAQHVHHVTSLVEMRHHV